MINWLFRRIYSVEEIKALSYRRKLLGLVMFLSVCPTAFFTFICWIYSHYLPGFNFLYSAIISAIISPLGLIYGLYITEQKDG